MTAMGFHTTESVVLLLLTASVWMAVGVTHTCPALPGPSCVSGSTCCDNPDQPWFKKKLAQSANEDMEMRWCGNAIPSTEVTATTRVELHIRVD